MAGDSDDDEGSRSDCSEVAKCEPKMKCCPTRGCKVYVCGKCHAVYHKSCSKKYPNLKIIDPDTCTVVCCGDEPGPKNSSSGELDIAKYRELELECKYLKMLLEEVSDKNKVLQLSNDLLLEKLGGFKKPGRVISGEQSREQELKSSCNNEEDPSVRIDQRRRWASVGNAVEHVQPKGATGGKSEDKMRTSRTSIPSHQEGRAKPITGRHMINVSLNRPEVEFKDEQLVGDVPSERKDEGYQTVVNKRRYKYKKRLGTGGTAGDQVGDFAGGDRKVWLYLHRVKRTATEKIITDFIKNKPGFEQEKVTVRELPTDEDKLKCFVVTAPLERKDDMYDRSFWPNHVGIKRFDFKKHRSFLDQAGSFL